MHKNSKPMRLRIEELVALLNSDAAEMQRRMDFEDPEDVEYRAYRQGARDAYRHAAGLLWDLAAFAEPIEINPYTED